VTKSRQSMRILVVSQYFHPENFRVNDLSAWLVDRGHEVTVLTGIPNYPSGRFFPGYDVTRRRHETWKGVEIVRVPLVSRGKGGGLRLALNYISFALVASLLGPLRLRRNYDVIFVHEPSPVTVGIPAIAMRKGTNAPILFWVLDLWPESVTAAGGVRAPWVLSMLTWLTRWIYGHCEKVLVASRAFIPRVVALGVAEERIVYFPNWAEDVFQPSSAAEPPVPLAPGFRVMFAGNIGVAQDFPAILDAAERLKNHPDIHWIVLGDGHIGAWVREEVTRRGIGATVHLLGSYPPEQMPQFFAHADAMLVSLKPDPVFALTVPAKLQAYMACGRPIIAMLDGEGARIVEEAGAGLTCPAGASHGLAEAVLSMARLTPQARAMMGIQARAYSIANFEREQIFCRLEAWMVEAAGR
jgi:colanic acid biosynthesis glycosyl transferase WcaI